MKQNGRELANPELKTPSCNFSDNFRLRSPAQDTKLQFNCPPGNQRKAVEHFKASWYKKKIGIKKMRAKRKLLAINFELNRNLHSQLLGIGAFWVREIPKPEGQATQPAKKCKSQLILINYLIRKSQMIHF